MREKITQLFEKVGEDYKKRNIVTYEINQGHDIHAFYRLPRNVENLVHVQGYPGMSTERGARVYARVMDYNKTMAIRKAGGVSIGNEHKAVVKQFPNFKCGVVIPYEAKILEEMLGENISELNPDILIPVFGPPELEGKQIVPIDKWSLRDYLKTVDLRDSKKLEERSGEIMVNVRNVMKPYVERERGEPLRDYYAPGVKFIEDAFRKRDFQKSFPNALNFMIDSVDWE